MQTRTLLIWITFLAVFTMAARMSVDTDTWWHLRAGEWMVENRQILQVDYFSHTRYGEPWRYPGWLVEIPMYWIYRLAGPGGLNLWTAAMVTLMFAFVWRTQSGSPYLRAFITVLAVIVSAVHWAARPFLITLLLTAIYLWILEEWRWKDEARSDRYLLWLPVIMVVWANSHGGFAAGFLLLGVYLAGEVWGWGLQTWLRLRDPGRTTLEQARHAQRLRRLSFIILLTLIATILTPLGASLLRYPFYQTVEIKAAREYILEWQPPDFHDLRFHPFLWLLLLTVGAVGASRRRLALTDFLLFSGFAYLGFVSARNIALFALAAPLVLSRYSMHALGVTARWLRLKPLGGNTPPGLRRLNLVLLLMALLAVFARVILIVPQTTNEEFFRNNYPVAAVEALAEADPPGNLFNSYNYGGYLVWVLRDYPVFVDGRADLFGDEIINEWLAAVSTEQGWENTFDERKIGVVLIEPGTPLAATLATHPGWIELYQDALAVVYERAIP